MKRLSWAVATPVDAAAAAAATESAAATAAAAGSGSDIVECMAEGGKEGGCALSCYPMPGWIQEGGGRGTLLLRAQPPQEAREEGERKESAEASGAPPLPSPPSMQLEPCEPWWEGRGAVVEVLRFNSFFKRHLVVFADGSRDWARLRPVALAEEVAAALEGEGGGKEATGEVMPMLTGVKRTHQRAFPSSAALPTQVNSGGAFCWTQGEGVGHPSAPKLSMATLIRCMLRMNAED
jgi:hypothetical protein